MSDTQIIATPKNATPGPSVNVQVVGDSGASTTALTDSNSYRFIGPIVNTVSLSTVDPNTDQTITIEGTGFNGATSVFVGGLTPDNFTGTFAKRRAHFRER